MTLPETFSLRALSQGQRVLLAHRRVHKYQPVVFDILEAVVPTVAEGDFVAAVEVLVSVVPVEPPVGLAVLWAEIKLYSLQVVKNVMRQLPFTASWRLSIFFCAGEIQHLRSLQRRILNNRK